mmetsp:Transcript_60795/g.123301  ORF Transcript_60795/g.123301 Transcript_60795/m.123301 type:complete len:291 (-) Transcript_60795:566-1438(-)
MSCSSPVSISAKSSASTSKSLSPITACTSSCAASSTLPGSWPASGDSGKSVTDTTGIEATESAGSCGSCGSLSSCSAMASSASKVSRSCSKARCSASAFTSGSKGSGSKGSKGSKGSTSPCSTSTSASGASSSCGSCGSPSSIAISSISSAASPSLPAVNSFRGSGSGSGEVRSLFPAGTCLDATGATGAVKSSSEGVLGEGERPVTAPGSAEAAVSSFVSPTAAGSSDAASVLEKTSELPAMSTAPICAVRSSCRRFSSWTFQMSGNCSISSILPRCVAGMAMKPVAIG